MFLLVALVQKYLLTHATLRNTYLLISCHRPDVFTHAWNFAAMEISGMLGNVNISKYSFKWVMLPSNVSINDFKADANVDEMYPRLYALDPSFSLVIGSTSI